MPQSLRTPKIYYFPSINQSTVEQRGSAQTSKQKRSAQTLRHILVLNQSINRWTTWECADFAAKTECADFEAYPRTQSINQPLNNMGVRRLCSKKRSAQTLRHVLVLIQTIHPQRHCYRRKESIVLFFSNLKRCTSVFVSRQQRVCEFSIVQHVRQKRKSNESFLSRGNRPDRQDHSEEPVVRDCVINRQSALLLHLSLFFSIWRIFEQHASRRRARARARRDN